MVESVIIIDMPHYLDPEQIFPKRMGIMQGTTLVLQYYDLARDRFKKHLIQFQPAEDPKVIVQRIYKNQKHVPYLKKINPKTLRSVLEGTAVYPQKGDTRSSQQPKYSELVHQQQYYSQQQPYSPQQPYFLQQPYSQQQSYSQQNQHEFKENMNKVQEEYPKTQQIQKKSVIHQPETKVQEPEPEDYYNQEFQDFQMSQSIDKSPNFSASFSKVDPAQTQKENISESIIVQAPNQKKKKQKKKEVEEPIQEVIQEFDFIDQPKKKKKKSKGKSKEKSKKVKEVKTSKKESAAQEQFEFL